MVVTTLPNLEWLDGVQITEAEKAGIFSSDDDEYAEPWANSKVQFCNTISS